MCDFLIKIKKKESNFHEDIDINLNLFYEFPENYYFHKTNSSFFNSIIVNEKDNLDTNIYENKDFVLLISSPDNFIRKIFNPTNNVDVFSLDSKKINFFLKKPNNHLTNIRGAFSLVIYDKKKKKIFLFRDQIGLKSVFYFNNSKFIYISSSLRFLSESQEISKKINYSKIADFLEMKISSNTDTFYKDIFKLPPSSYVCINKNQKIVSKKYESLRNVVINNDNLEDTAKKINRLLLLALKRSKLHAEEKIGFLFSGGLDSSSILSLFEKNKLSGQKLFAFSSDYSELKMTSKNKIIENEYQDELLKNLKVEHQKINGTSYSTLDKLDTFLDVIGEPFFFPNLYVPYNCFIQAKKKSVNVIFNGNDGDTVISHGYEYLIQLFFSLRWVRLYKEILLISKKRDISGKLIFKRIIIDQTIKRFLFFSIDFFYLTNFFYKPFLAKKSFLKNNNFFRNNRVKLPKILALSYHRSVLEQFLAHDAIEKQGSIASFLGIKEQYPFYDFDLVRYCLSVNPAYKLRRGYQRFILREAMKNILPEKNRLRIDKADLSTALVWTLNNKDKDLVEESINNPHIFLQQKIDMKKLHKAWSQIREKSSKISGNSSELQIIFRYLVLNRWLIRKKLTF